MQCELLTLEDTIWTYGGLEYPGMLKKKVELNKNLKKDLVAQKV